MAFLCFSLLLPAVTLGELPVRFSRLSSVEDHSRARPRSGCQFLCRRYSKLKALLW